MNQSCFYIELGRQPCQ